MEKEKILDKIRKLLRLSSSPNEHEAARAAAKAASLMAEHEVSEADIAIESGDVTLETPDDFVLNQSKNRIGWQAHILDGVAVSFGCRAYMSVGYGTTLYRVIAVQSKLDAIKYTHEYLINAVNRLAEENYIMQGVFSGPGQAKSWKNSFRVGAAIKLKDRLREVRAQALNDLQASQGALMRIDKQSQLVDDLASKLGLRSMKGRALRHSAAFSAGAEAADKIRLGGASRSLGMGPKRIGTS